jgi:hypothetical protein
MVFSERKPTGETAMLHVMIYTVFAAAIFGLTVLASPAAKAFTLENSATNSDGSAKYAPNSTTTRQFGTTTTTTTQGGVTTQMRTRQGASFGTANDYFDRYNSPFPRQDNR